MNTWNPHTVALALLACSTIVTVPAQASVRLLELSPNDEESEVEAPFTLEVSAYSATTVHFWLTAQPDGLVGVYSTLETADADALQLTLTESGIGRSSTPRALR